MKKIALAALFVCALGSLGSSHAAAQVVVAPPGALVSGYFDSPLSLAVKSQPVQFANLDPLGRHNIKAIAYGPSTAPWCGRFGVGKCPLFVSDLVDIGGTSTADLRNVTVGATYDFVCELHGNMHGQLRIVA